MKDKLLLFWEFYEKQNRICPQPKLWDELWKMLLNKKQVGAGWQPSVPLILNGWSFSTDEEKKVRFKNHIDWAVKEQQIDPILNFLNNLTESDWHHYND